MRMRISFDRVADVYDKTRGLPTEVMNSVMNCLSKELKGEKTILDIGVGTGRFARPLQENGFDVVGIDIARDMVNEARRKEARNLTLGDACFLPFQKASFDDAISVHVLHLISDWREVLREICRVTKKELFSVAQMPRSPISEAYEQLAESKGYNAAHVGLSERKIMDLVRPRKSILVASMISDGDEYLTFLKERAYSRQWRVPEDLDKLIVGELISRFTGKKYKVNIHVLRWRIDDIKAYLRNQGWNL
jgi:ubiquinone/menaquinone biosynthesis C-methylase UbiE